MTSRMWMWLAAGLLVLMLGGCVSRRQSVATIAPSYSYVDVLGAGDVQAMWRDGLRDSVHVQTVLGDVPAHSP